jgi:peptide chain release factor 2
VHKPTGIIIFAQEQRSQHQNKDIAYKRLRARLYDLELKKREEKASAEQASKTEIGWGHQIRSYVLQPYQMVKDLRTGTTSGNPAAVLNGDIDQFIESTLAMRMKGGAVKVEDIE